MRKSTDYINAKNRLDSARSAMRANELRIQAYEHKLRKEIDPDSADWDRALEKLNKLRQDGEELLHELAVAHDEERKIFHELQAAV